MKRLMAMIAAVILVLGLSTTVFAAATAPSPGAGYGYGRCGGAGAACYGLMWDDDGNFLSKEAFEANLDKALEDGLVRAEDESFFLEMYDYCAEYGGGANGMRGGCGMGRRWQ